MNSPITPESYRRGMARAITPLRRALPDCTLRMMVIYLRLPFHDPVKSVISGELDIAETAIYNALRSFIRAGLVHRPQRGSRGTVSHYLLTAAGEAIFSPPSKS